MPTIRVEYTEHDTNEHITIDREISDPSEMDKTFEDIKNIVMGSSQGSLYEGYETPETDEEQYTFQFTDTSSLYYSSSAEPTPFEKVVADQVAWNEKTKENGPVWPFPNDRPVGGKLSEDIDVSDKPAQQTLRVDSDEDNNFYYNGA
jgi:hypothetical protein